MKLKIKCWASLYLMLLVCFIFCVNINSFSQNDSIKFDVLGEENIITPINKNEIKIISASRSSKKLEDLPVTTYVITHDEIIQNGYITLVDVLKSIPGIRVSQPGSGELGEMFEMRGLQGNSYTKILINNLPVKPSVLSGMSLDAQLPVRQAERIEVILGPASAVYGADATAGVINIITKEAENGIFSAADISIGGNGYRYINFHVGGKAGKNKNILKYSIYGSQCKQDSLNIFNDSKIYKPLSFLDQTHPGFDFGGTHYSLSDITQQMYLQMNDTSLPHNYDGNADAPVIKAFPLESQMIGVELKYKKWSVSYQNMHRKSNSSIGRTSYLFKYNNPMNFIDERFDIVSISRNKQYKNILSTFNFQFINYELSNNSSFGVTWIDSIDNLYIYSTSKDIYLEQLFTYSGKKLEIVTGVTFQGSLNLPQTNYSKEPFNTDKFHFLDSISDPEFGTFGYNPNLSITLSGFLQGYYVLGKLSLVGGIRFDNNSNYGSSINIRLASLYKLGERTIFRISGGTAFKAPAPNTKYRSLAYKYQSNPDSVYYAIVPNRNLKPEQSLAFELGLRRTFFENIFLDLAIFSNSIRNLIISSIDDNIKAEYPNAAEDEDDHIRKYVNSSEAVSSIYGSEISLKLNNLMEAIKLNTELSFTFSKSIEILPNGQRLNSINKSPMHTGKIKITMVPLQKTYLCLDGNWSTGWNRSYLPDADYYEKNPDYPKINGFFVLDGIFSFRMSKNINWFIKMTNIFDTKYGGIDATSMDIDLRYNPQYGRNTRVGLTFVLN